MRKEDRKLGIIILTIISCVFISIIAYNILVIRGRKSDLKSLENKKTITTVGYVYKTARAGRGLDYNAYPSFIVAGNRIEGEIPFVSRKPLPINALMAIKYFEENPYYYKIIKDTVLYSSNFKFEYVTIRKKRGIWAGEYKCDISAIE